jgi:hypothetical protein
MVMRSVSRIQPSTNLRVSQKPRPLRNFLTEVGSWRVVLSPGSSGRKTLSRVWKRTRRRLVSAGCWYPVQ